MTKVQRQLPRADLCQAQPHFIVGQDPHGWWLAIETHNLGGGLFKSRQDALHFVGFETDHRPGAFELATKPLELTF
jgi:hypothetical protein